MKKVVFLLIMLFLFPLYTSASTYTQGVTTGLTTVYSTPDKSSILKNDTGGNISLGSREAFEILGEENGLYKIKFIYSAYTYIGYASKTYITKTVYNLDDTYKESLISKGFPSDYADKLTILHAIHPNWTFTPSVTNMDFNTAVLGEASVIDRNLINGSNTTLRSTEDGAYNNGVWKTFDNGSWYAASKQTIGFFLDPRNFLDEEHVFMFENVGYSEYANYDAAAEKLLSSTFMATNKPFYCSELSNKCSLGNHIFKNTFIETGRDKKVSPVHLITRVVQEQGSSGSVLSLGSGYNGEYAGYYNFFNIGASGNGKEDVIRNGFIYAVNKNWNNQHVSIYEGAALIATNYVSRGQSTRYYQKFNTIAAPYYGNQYQQNVKAPYSESYSAYDGYFKASASKAEWDNQIYDFLIPIYLGMPQYTTLDSSLNADATLKSLTVSKCNLNPAFQSSAYEYSCYVNSDVNEVTLNAEKSNPNASITYNDKVKLTSEQTIIEIKVTAANGNTLTYKVVVNKVETDGYTPAEIMNGVGIVVSGSYITNIPLSSDISNIASAIKSKYHFAQIKMYRNDGTVINDGVVSTGKKITIDNAGAQSTFTISIYGDTNGDGVIDIRDLLSVQKHLLKSKVLTGEYLKASDINKDQIVDIRDLLLVQKHLVGAYTISQ